MSTRVRSSPKSIELSWWTLSTPVQVVDLLRRSSSTNGSRWRTEVAKNCQLYRTCSMCSCDVSCLGLLTMLPASRVIRGQYDQILVQQSESTSQYRARVLSWCSMECNIHSMTAWIASIVIDRNHRQIRRASTSHVARIRQMRTIFLSQMTRRRVQRQRRFPIHFKSPVHRVQSKSSRIWYNFQRLPWSMQTFQILLRFG